MYIYYTQLSNAREALFYHKDKSDLGIHRDHRKPYAKVYAI